MKLFHVFFMSLFCFSGSSQVVPKFQINPLNPARKKWILKFPKQQLIGDFDGDGIEEVLYESLISKLTGRRIDSIQYFGEYDFGNMVICNLDPELKLKSKSKKYDLKLVEHCQTFGLMRVINLGNVNEYPGDEIAMIIDWADWSNCNSCRVYSFQNNNWMLAKQFDIHETTVYMNEYSSTEIKGVIEKERDGWYYCERHWDLGEIWHKLAL